MSGDKNNGKDRGRRDEGNKYDRAANIPGSGNKIIDKRREEAQDKANKDREEQQE